ncbi:MAG: S1C family serine protease [Acidimicrobiales bacterium]
MQDRELRGGAGSDGGYGAMSGGWTEAGGPAGGTQELPAYGSGATTTQAPPEQSSPAGPPPRLPWDSSGQGWPSAPPPTPVRSRPKGRAWIAVVIVAALIGALVGGVAGATMERQGQQTIVKEFFPNKSVASHSMNIQAVLAKVMPAVVSIKTTAFTGGSLFSSGLVKGAGTGMILTSNGEVLTNNHVIAGATSISVTLYGQTKAYPATVIGTNPTKDVALIQVHGAKNLPTVTLGNSSTSRVGDSVVAIGNALALAGGPTVTNGIISATNRTVNPSGIGGATEHLTGMIQTSAAINPGNSGGPLVDAAGHVVAMDTAVAQTTEGGQAIVQNIGFAIPVNEIKPLLPQLRKGGTAAQTTAFVGVSTVTLTPSIRAQYGLTPHHGVVIAQVVPGSPAQNAGLQVGDVVTSFNGTSVTSNSQFASLVHSKKPGTTVRLGVNRGGTARTVHLTLGSVPASSGL